MLDLYVARCDPIAARQFDDEVAVVTLRDHEVHLLNATAARVWNAIDGSKRVRELVAAVVAVYDVVPDQAVADVCELIETLRAKGVVRLLSTPTGEAARGAEVHHE